MSRQTITGELRKWHHDTSKRGEKCVIGLMYHDTNDIWENGEGAVIFYDQWVEAPTYYLAVSKNHTCVKCPKDEEQTNAHKTFNGPGSNLG